MKTNLLITKWLTILAFSIISLQLSTVFAQGTAFTYQGRLTANGNPAAGNYDFRFRLASDAQGNNYVGSPATTNAVPVANGLFTVALDFGGVFSGSSYWLEIDVRTNGAGGYSILLPLQPITPTPYAITAENLNGTVPVSQLSGTVPLAQLPSVVLTNNESGVALGNLTLNGNLNLPATTSGAGIIYAGGSPLIQSYGYDNFFAGPSAGNLTMSGSYNTAIGVVAFQNNTSGGADTAVGVGALQNNTSGSWNTANGENALQQNTTGGADTAVGAYALQNNASGSWNTAIGLNALQQNTTGVNNTANGAYALEKNTNGYNNTATGVNALRANTTGFNNVANGLNALQANTTGYNNTADGVQALYANTTGVENTSSGNNSLLVNTNGSRNTANGSGALGNNTSGSYNIALGYSAGANLTSGNNNIDIGNGGVDGDNGVIRLGTPWTHTTTLLAGNVGIGTQSPMAGLHVSTGPQWSCYNFGANLVIDGSRNNAIGLLDFASSHPWAIYNGGGALMFSQMPPLGNVTDPSTNRFTIAADGTVIANSFSGSGAGLTGLNAANLTGSAGNFTLNGNLYLPATTASAGIIYAGGSPLIQSYGGGNFFAGPSAGNLTMSGSYNSAIGFVALQANTSGGWNAALGAGALQNNTSGSWNAASGYRALTANMTGDNNTANGMEALANNTNGSGNIALGALAGLNLTSGNNNIDIGNAGTAIESGVIRIGTPGTHTTTILAGNVGIGTNLPQTLLHLAGTAADLRMRSENLNAWGASILDLAVPGGTAELLEAGTNYPVWGGPFSLNLINVGGTGPLTFNHFLNGSPVEHMRITSAGNVGIGTTSPSKPLEVDAAGDAEIGLRSTDPNGHLWTVQSSAVEGDADVDATFQIIDRTLSVSRLLIATNGNVGIGKTSPATALDVNGTVTATSFSGSGAGLTGLNAGSLSGSISNINSINVTGSVKATRFSGDGSGLTGLSGGTAITNTASLVTISQPGSYYLTHNLTVSTGDGIDITANGVTLDLNGYTISSTAASAAGSGILLGNGLSDITVCNGHIRGGVTNNGSGVYNGGGFAYGISYSGSQPVNVLVSRVSVSGCQYDGIFLNVGDSTVVQACTVRTVGSRGVYAATIKNCSAMDCGNTAIYGDQVSDCRGQCSGSAYGVYATTAQNCYGQSSSYYGLSADTALNCYGYSYGSGTGLYARSALNCHGISSSYYGLSADTALNCYGYSYGSGIGLSAASSATGCYGYSFSGTGLHAFIANVCHGESSSGTALSTSHNVNSY